MKYFSTVTALVSIVPSVLSMTINTPTSVVQCQPQLLSWGDGMAPYYLTIIPGGQPSATPLKSFDTQSGSSITWIVDIAAGTQLTFALKDSTGATAYTDVITVQPGSDSSCLSGGSGSSSKTSGSAGAVTTQATDATSSAAVGSTGAGTTGTSRAAAAASSGTSRAATTGTPASVSAQRTTSAAAAAGTSSTSSSTTSGAQSHFNVGGYLVAGIVGLVGGIVL